MPCAQTRDDRRGRDDVGRRTWSAVLTPEEVEELKDGLAAVERNRRVQSWSWRLVEVLELLYRAPQSTEAREAARLALQLVGSEVANAGA